MGAIEWYPDKETIAQNKKEYKEHQLVYYTPIEELFNAITHALGVVAAFIGLGFMLHYSSEPRHYIASVIVFIGFFGLYFNSTIYHATYKKSVKKYLRIFDHATVNALVLANAATLSLCTSDNPYNFIAFGISCGIIIFSYILSFINLKRFSLLIFFNNFIIGFMMLATYIINRSYFPQIVMAFYLSGLIFCLIGAVIYAIKKPFTHTIFHLFVLFGPVCFLIAQILFLKSLA